MDEGNSGSVLGAGSSEAPAPEVVSDWRSGLPEDVAGDPSLADIKDVSSLAKSYVHAQRMVGRDKVSIPQEGAGEDEWNSFYDRLGRPEKYEINKIIRNSVHGYTGLDWISENNPTNTYERRAERFIELCDYLVGVNRNYENLLAKKLQLNTKRLEWIRNEELA